MENQVNSENIDKLKAAAQDAPNEPGIYIMRNLEGQIIYIGKAKSLKNRIKSYFSWKLHPSGSLEGTGEKDIKTATLMRRVCSLETIIVASEYEAFLLENTLIKQHSPKYNISLKDGKTYPVIRITHEDFPRVFKTRRIIQDKSQYYGPFPDSRNVDAMMETIDKLFPLRKCKKMKNSGPCMYYHIKRCSAPCCKKITVIEYAAHVQHVHKLLSGESESLFIDLTVKMHEAARELKFESAAQIRNAIRAIENLSGKESSVEDLNPEDRDYIAWACEGVLCTFTVFSMRGGKMTGRDLFRTRSAADEWESLEMFITTYYDGSRPPPGKVYFQNLISQRRGDAENAEKEEREEKDSELISQRRGVAENAEEEEREKDLKNNNFIDYNLIKKEKIKISNNISATSAPLRLCESNIQLLLNWFREKFGYLPELLIPTEKHHEAIMSMAHMNAKEDLRKRLKERGAGPALDEIARVLSMKAIPERIEGFDIAHLDGKHPVASLISFKNGVPDRKNYRYFKLRTVIGKVDDYAAIREVIKRRYSRLIREGKELPDLILVDGGLGQVNAAKGVLNDLGIDSGTSGICLVGLAKREEELWLPEAKKPLVLSRQSEALKVLQHVRDECHRFATGLNQRLRSKDLFFPILESVEGIGPKRALAIMKVYESIANIAAAEPAEMAQRCRISEEAARAVRAVARVALEERG